MPMLFVLARSQPSPKSLILISIGFMFTQVTNITASFNNCTVRTKHEPCPVICKNGKCLWSSQFGQYTCKCDEGWTGVHCSVCDSTQQFPLHRNTTGCSLKGRYPPQICQEDISCYNGPCLTQEFENKCECHDGWQGSKCDVCCDRNCHNGTCKVDPDTMEMYCNCHTGYQQPDCSLYDDDITPTAQPILDTIARYWPYPLAILAIPTVVVIVLAVLVHRKHPFVVKLVLRVFYKFKKFEDDDSLQYDAFVSYRTSNDEDRLFVTTILYPKLDRLGYKLCIDEKDFIPGAAVVENILEGIEQSRRSVLVVSPAYCEGEWPDFEQQVALKESVTKRHRIIPIIFKDVSSVKKTRLMEHILHSVTYIEWPGSDNETRATAFWKTLYLSLPKLRRMEQIQNGDCENRDECLDNSVMSFA